MNFDRIVTALCKLASQTADGAVSLLCSITGATSAVCLDWEYAADHPEECTDGITITGFYVAPASGSLEVGEHYQLESYLTFSNGKEKKVTDVSEWHSNVGSVAVVVNSTGECTGEQVGIATVTASYRGYTDYAQLTVAAACVQSPLDVCIVIDRSESMLTKDLDGRTRLEKTVEAAQGLVENLRLLQGDRASVISFAGVYDPQVSGPGIKSPAGTNHLSLSANVVDIGVALESIVIENCQFTNNHGLTATNCSTGIGQGLKLAQAEFNANGGTNRKVVVLLTDGMEVICDPEPEALSDTMKNDEFTHIIVIALAVPDIDALDCGGGTVNVPNYLRSLASCDQFFEADTPNDLIDIYSRIPSTICHGNLDDACFYYVMPYTPPPVARCYRDRLDYTGFKNWEVIGKVDLVGRDLFPIFPGHGSFVDLVGTDVIAWNNPHATSLDACGALQSRTEFTFTPGDYSLTMQLSGNKQQQGRTGDEVLVQVGSLFSQVVPLAANAPFTGYIFSFSVGKSSKAKVLIKQYKVGGKLTPVFDTTVGNCVNDIVLTNLTTGVVMLTDTFDDEGVCPD